MNRWGVLTAFLTCAGCSAEDGVAAGARDQCAHGGELTDCPDAERTTMAACWRLVDCGAIPVMGDEQYRFDWDRCVDSIDSLSAESQRLVINCIAASTCDQLKVDGSPDSPNTDQMLCLQLGRGE
jgi:hypothetical protein